MSSKTVAVMACLWCGGAKAIAEAWLDLYVVRCTDCGACGPMKGSRGRAVQCWNSGPKFHHRKEPKT